MITDEEMKQALQTLKDGCTERGCLSCPISYTCDIYFISDCSPCSWELEEDRPSDE